jgi:hypothetical protein
MKNGLLLWEQTSYELISFIFSVVIQKVLMIGSSFSNIRLYRFYHDSLGLSCFVRASLPPHKARQADS